MADYFSVRDVTWVLSLDSVTLTAVTDVPCHLYMRWTLTKPRVHSKSSVRRGLALMKDVRFCFVNYKDNEQEEAGDTLTHTFTKPNWPVCEVRHFYFWGYVAEIVSESTSPLFKLHNDFVGPGWSTDLTRFAHCREGTSGAIALYNDNQSGQWFTCPEEHKFHYLWLHMQHKGLPCVVDFWIYAVGGDHFPAGPALSTGQYVIPNNDADWIWYLEKVEMEQFVMLPGSEYCWIGTQIPGGPMETQVRWETQAICTNQNMILKTPTRAWREYFGRDTSWEEWGYARL